MPGIRSLTGRLIVAALAAAAAMLLRLALGSMHPAPPFLTLVPAVLVAAVLGGRVAGLAAAVVGAAAEGLLLPPPPPPPPGAGPGFGPLGPVVAFVAFGIAAAVMILLGGELHHSRAASRDRAEQVVRDAERLEAAFAGAPVGFALCDRRGLVLHLNRALADLCSRPASQLIGQSIEVVLPSGAAPREALEQVFASGRPALAREWTGHRASGEERTWLVSLYPVYAGKPDEVELVGLLVQDVSLLARAAADLEQRAGELSENDRRKDVFLAMLSHELRNPLAALRSATDLLALGEPARGEVLTLFRRQLALMTRLVDDLLDVARVTRGQVEVRRHTVSLPDVIEAALETARPVLDERRHFVETVLPSRPVMVRGDAARLTQAVSNLLVNAARYTPPGGSVSLRLEVEGGDAALRVTDTGMGIAPEMLGRIFELFHQGDPPPGQPREGLGLGLTLVRRLVELHGGTVSATSPGPGQGSTFEIRLPVLPMTTTPSPHPPSNVIRPPSQRVLVVDDNADAAESLSLLLQVQGHEVKVVHDGPAAVDEVAAWKPHVVFLDVGLPGMDGFEVVKEVRQRHGEGSPRLIALTGFGHESDRQKGLEAGFDEFLVKPAGPEDLCRAITGDERRE